MSTILTRGAEGLDRRGFSFAEIEAMQTSGILDPDEKFELIDGEIVPMNAQNMPHMLWKARINRWLALRLPSNLFVGPGKLRLFDVPATAFETDLLIFEPEPGAQAIRPPMVKLAIEVADTSRERDLVVKAPRYGAAGVSELWVVDVTERVTRVHRQPIRAGYADIRAVAFAEPLSPLFDLGLVITLAELE